MGRSGTVQGGWFRIRSMPIHNLNFGYPWWISYGHLPILGGTAAILALGYFRGWSKWLMIVLGMVALWSSASFLLIRFGFDINGSTGSLPTQSFLRSGTGRVLDIGAGTGRSSIMVLQARPHATLVASDLFGESFDQHFGHSESPQQRLLANLRAAGVEQHATIETADMRKLPFEAASFDAAVSAYAMDHLNREGSTQALIEAGRVVKPGGDFLLMLFANDRWVKFAIGPLAAHGGFRGLEWWAPRIKDAGFEVLEEGTSPATHYFLARRR